MKKQLLNLCLSLLSVGTIYAQCVPTCSSYAISSITYTTYPTGGNNVVPMFTPNADDGYSPAIPIGFSFDFYCLNTNSVIIGSNGFLLFDIFQTLSPATSQVAPSIFNGGIPNAFVAFHYNDLDPSSSGGGTVTYTTIGTAPNQKFIVTYSNVPIWNNNSNLSSGQIVLNETTNMIEIHTAAVANASPYNGTQGIENTTGSAGVAVPGRNQAMWTATNSAYLFSPYTPAPPTSITGNTTLCQGEQAFYQAAFMTGSTAYGWSFPSGWVGTSTLSSITATAGVSGNLSVTATYTCGTSAPATIAVNVVPAPIVSIVSASPSILCSGKTVTFNTSGAVTYTLDPGGINGVPPFTDIVSVSTTYTLSGTNAAGCVSQNNPTQFITVKETPTVTVNSGTVCNGQTFTLTPSGAPSYVYSSLFPTVTPSVGVYSYSVTGTGTNGCVSEPAVSTLTVFALPTVTAAASRTAICMKESVVLTAGGASTYTWNNNATTNTISVSPNSTSVYSAIGTDTRGCVNSASVTVTVKACTGINEMNEDLSGVEVYPNPSNGKVFIKLNTSEQFTSAQVFNSTGQLILETKINSEETSIDLSAYSNGFYYLKLNNSSSANWIKLIKE